MGADLSGAANAASAMAIVAMRSGAIFCPAIRRIFGPVQPGAMTWDVGWLLRIGSREIESPKERAIRNAGIVAQETWLGLYDGSSDSEIVRRLKTRLMPISSDELEALMDILNENADLIFLYAQDLIAQAMQLAPDDCRVITLSTKLDINGEWSPL